MITRQRFYMMISILCMLMAVMVYGFNSYIIPGKIRRNTEAILSELKAKYTHVYILSDGTAKKGTYVNEMNYTELLQSAYIYTDHRLDAVSFPDIQNGFYLKRDMGIGEILVRSDTNDHMPVKGSRLYEIRVVNSFCGELRPGETVDLICIEDGYVNPIAESKQVRGVYGYSNSRYIEAGKIQAESETVIFVDLTEIEFERYLEHERIFVRRMCDAIDN